MSMHRPYVLLAAVLMATVLSAVHAPGQISVDSGIALYEGIVGHAVGWGPTFFAAVLSWLGGGVLGASVFVALNCLATYGIFAALLSIGVDVRRLAKWRLVVAALLAINPLFMLYVGIIWKDVMLASTAAVAVVLLLFVSRLSGKRLLLALLAAAVCIAMLPLLRQQGILLAAPLAMVSAWVAGCRLAASARGRVAVMAASIILTGAISLLLSVAASSRVAALPSSPISVGIVTIRAYDIIGMVAYARPEDRSDWTGASADAIERMRVGYSPERIDTVWHDEKVRGYINSMSAEQSRDIWLAGIRHDPEAYLSHRIRAFGALMGFGPVSGCVPAYWGVAAVPEHLSALGVLEEMDPRDRLIGAEVKQLEPSMVFRHWWYAGLLLIATALMFRRGYGSEAWVLRAAALAAWMYLGSFLPTTIACDFRYLYPVSLLATVICMYMLLHPRQVTVDATSAKR